MDTNPDPEGNRIEGHQPKEAPLRFWFTIQKGATQEGIEILQVKSKNEGMPLPEIILIVETWLDKVRAHYKSSLAGMSFKT